MKYLVLILLTGCVVQAPVKFFDADENVRSLSDSIRKIYIVTPKGIGSGTAWAISKTKMVTAGHVCAHALSGGMLTVPDQEGHQIRFEVDKVDVDVDMCVISVASRKRHPFVPLRLRSQLLKPGEQVYIYGAPLGVPDMLTMGWAGGLMPIDTAKGPIYYRLYSTPVVGGNSGSPVMDKDGNVVGLLVMSIVGYEHLSLGVTDYRLRLFLTPNRANR